MPNGFPHDIPGDLAPEFLSDRHPPGLLPPAYDAGTVCGFVSDHPEAVEIIPSQEWDAYIKDEDEDDAPVEQFCHLNDQDGAGSCAMESTGQGVEIIEQVQGCKWVDLAPWFGYHHTRSGDNGGSSHDRNLAFLRSTGICEMSIWPRSKGWRKRPSDEAYENAKQHRIDDFLQIRNWEELGSCLIARKPCIVGWPGHSIIATRIQKNKNTLTILNSWGNWERNGYGDLSRNRLVWGYGVYAILTSLRHKE